MKKLPLSQGKYALVDDEDFEFLNKWHWSYSRHHTSGGTVLRNDKGKMIKLHRQIMGAKSGQQVDHINRDRLDNRRSNLRFCDNSQNRANSKIRKDNQSGYAGVHFNKDKKKWQAILYFHSKKYFLGYFTDKNNAIKARQEAESKIFKDYASA